MDNKKFLVVKPTQSEISRLMSRVTVDEQTGCWNWTGSASHGYGNITYRGRVESSHRVFYAWKINKIPRGEGRDTPQLDHLCRNTLCCNPEHLELVSYRENILRGNSPSSLHAKQTHCKNGHLLPEEFNYHKPNGQGVRICKICEYEHEHSDERKATQKKARFAREHGPRREEYLRKHREQQALYLERLRQRASAP